MKLRGVDQQRHGMETLAGARAWRTLPGKGVSVHAPEDSYAAAQAAAELRSAERALAVLVDLLAPDAEVRGEHVDVYLVDAVPDNEGGEPASAAAAHGLVRTLAPDAPGEPIVVPLTHLAVRRWFGDAAEQATIVVRGIAGLAGAQTDTGPALADADEWVRTRLAEGGRISIFGGADAGDADGSVDEEAASAFVATSFVGFLVDTLGADALRRFLAAYDPDRRDRAALSAYERPLGSLEELWLSGLQKRYGTAAAFRALWRQLVPLFKPHWLRWSEVMAYTLVGMLYTVAVPLAFKYLFDSVIPSRRMRNLELFMLVIFGVFALNTVIRIRRSYVGTLLNQRILLGLQERMYERLQRLSHDFYARARVGDLMARLSDDLGTVHDTLTSVVNQGVYLVFSGAAAVVTALVLSPLLGVLILIVVPLFSISYLVLLGRVQRASHEVQRLLGAVSSETQENLSAHAVVKAFGMEQRALASYRSRLTSLFRAFLRLVLLGAFFDASVGVAVTLGQLLVIGVGGYLVIHGDLTIGTLVAFVGLLPTFFDPIVSLAGVGAAVQAASGSMTRVLEVLEEPLAVADAPDAAVLARVAREIRLDGVTFGYEPGRSILRELDLVVHAGTHAAIVGPSGSGKSTVVNLLLRFWDPQEGRVAFDGHDARAVTLESLRGQIAVVFQDTVAFDTTIRENIAIGRTGATDAEVAAAAKAAQLDDFIDSLPAGYDTLLGERGVRISGGQRQRLAIARALLRDPAILILDEATSALDARTEAELLETLSMVTRGRTTISVTHRLSHAAAADRIFVLEQGRVVETGTHAQLVGAGGLYQRLYEEQTGFARLGITPLRIEAEQLRAIPLFADLDDAELFAVAERLSFEQFVADAEIVRQDEPGRKLYVIARGKVEVIRSGAYGDRRVSTLQDGDYFGEMALLTGEPRWATVRALIATDVYSLSHVDFAALMRREPRIALAIRETVAQRRVALETAVSAAGPPRGA